MRVQDLANRKDHYTSQCRTCTGAGEQIVRYEADHEVQYSDLCLRTDYGYLSFYSSDFSGQADTNALTKNDVKRGWIWMRSLIVYPGYCVHFREKRGDGGAWAFYCNCHKKQTDDRRAVGFSNFHDFGDKGWRRAKRFMCKYAPKWIEAHTGEAKQILAGGDLRAHNVNKRMDWRLAGRGLTNGRPREIYSEF
jgi:hypothetical protein